MPKKKPWKPLPDPETLLKMHETMTWDEIGAKYNYTGSHVMRLATGYKPKRAPVDYDPFQFYPWLRNEVTEEQLENWRKNRVCLCGCGTPVKQAMGGHRQRVPYGAYTPFAKGHHARFKHHRLRAARQAQDPVVRAKSSRTIRGQMVNSGIVVELLQEYMRDNNLSLEDMVRRTGITHLKDVITQRQRKTIRPVTAARILVAIGEPLPDHLAKELEAYQAKQSA